MSWKPPPINSEGLRVATKIGHARVSNVVGVSLADTDKSRWIADLETLELSERQADGSYIVAYDMIPISKRNAMPSLPDRLRQMAIDACAFQKINGGKLDALLHEAADQIERPTVVGPSTSGR